MAGSLRAGIAHALVFGVCVAGVVGFGSVAHAEGLSVPNVGHGMSNPLTIDGSAAFWNPGMLGFIPETQLTLGGSLILGDVRYTRERRGIYQRADSFDFALPIAPDAIDPSLTGYDEQAVANPVGLAPSAFVAFPLGDSGVVMGFGVYAPYAAIVAFPDEGPQRWALQEATILTTYINPSVGYQVSDSFSFGAGIAYVVGLAELSKVLDMSSLEDLGTGLENPPINQENDFGPNAPPSVRELDVLSRPIRITDAFGGGFAFNAGIGWQPSDSVRVGFSYHHSVPMTFRGDFTLDMNDEFFTQDMASQGVQFDPIVSGDASISFTLPSSFNFAVGYDISDRVGVDLVTRLVRWSSVDAFDVRASSPQLEQPAIGLPATTAVYLPRNWNDSIWLESNLRFVLSDSVNSWVTVGYHSPAAPDSTIDAASPDGHFAVFGGGADIRLSDRLSLILDAEIQRTAKRQVRNSVNDLANGDYQMTLVNLGAHMQILF